MSNILYALVMIMGQQPWCMTDGDTYDCFFFSLGSCEQTVERYGPMYWCERNPAVYSLDEGDDW